MYPEEAGPWPERKLRELFGEGGVADQGVQQVHPFCVGSLEGGQGLT